MHTNPRRNPTVRALGFIGPWLGSAQHSAQQAAQRLHKLGQLHSFPCFPCFLCVRSHEQHRAQFCDLF